MSQRKIINLVTKNEKELKEILETIVQDDTIIVITQDDDDELTLYSLKSTTPMQIIGILDEAKQIFRNWFWDYKDISIEGEPL